MQILLPFTYVDIDNYTNPVKTLFDETARAPFTESYMGIACDVVLQDFTLMDSLHDPKTESHGIVTNF